jgi:uncharacterized repeat protein (TIGR03943 family)
MSKLGGLIEGCIVVFLGVAMSALVRADNYWLYLHPKFKWLTLTAGIMLVVVGVIALWYNRKPNLFRIVIFLAFTSFASMGYFWPNPTSSATSGPQEKQVSAKEESRIVLNGQEYIKINLGELYAISQEGLEEERADRYVARGIVKRSPELDEIGQFVLLRVFIWCCFADAVAVGFRVQGDQPEKFLDGQWVRVYGKLEKLPSQLAEPSVQVKGILSKALPKKDGIVAARVEKIEPPPIPFMFEFRKLEPYAY